MRHQQSRGPPLRTGRHFKFIGRAGCAPILPQHPWISPDVSLHLRTMVNHMEKWR